MWGEYLTPPPFCLALSGPDVIFIHNKKHMKSQLEKQAHFLNWVGQHFTSWREFWVERDSRIDISARQKYTNDEIVDMYYRSFPNM
jgi:hypothetical protein